MSTDNEILYRQLYRIRRFEETVLEKFPKGVFFGTTHTYLGQEADAVGVLAHLADGDIVFSNHRGHGHFLAYGGDMRALFAEMMGRSTGVCGGRGGSQHLQRRDFYSNGVQGGIAPVATGMALAEKIKASQGLAVCFIGDGTLGEGVLYEALNMASLWDAPVLFVVENNQIAQTTPVELVLAGEMAARFSAFDIPVSELDSSDVLEITSLAGDALADIRENGGPRAMILNTCRFGPHSKGDDTRDPDVIAAFQRQRDPVVIHAPRVDTASRAAIESEVNSEVEAAFEQALADPFPAASDPWIEDGSSRPAPTYTSSAKTVLQSLNGALHQSLQSDEKVILLGEDILDPYGGAFKVTQGLSDAFPERVLTTPISEAGITGLAAGMALRGLRPVVEIMFGDFVTLIADQVINHIAKFRWMYNDQVRVPLVIRTPMGGRRGYGPTHSQTLEKLFLGVPGLRVLAPTALGDPGALLSQAVADDDPVLFIENKILYLAKLQDEDSLKEFDLRVVDAPRGYAPTYCLAVRGAPQPELTIAAYGHMAELAREALQKLAFEHEIFAELVVPTQLSPFDIEPVFQSVRRTHRLLVCEEGTFTLGWGAEVLARTVETIGTELHISRRVAAQDLPVPASGPLEDAMLPGVQDILQAVQEMMGN
jgi:2-oxoisovalerate dehydrogenase E1 component